MIRFLKNIIILFCEISLAIVFLISALFLTKIEFSFTSFVAIVLSVSILIDVLCVLFEGGKLIDAVEIVVGRDKRE